MAERHAADKLPSCFENCPKHLCVGIVWVDKWKFLTIMSVFNIEQSKFSQQYKHSLFQHQSWKCGKGERRKGQDVQPTKFEETYKKNHPEEKSYKCSQCNIAFVQAAYRRHLRTHSGEKPSVWLCSYSYRHCHVIWKPTLEKNPEKWFARLIQSLISFFIQGLKNQGPSAFSAVARKFPVLLEKSRGVSIFTLDRRESVFSEVIPCNDRLLIKIGNNIVALVGPLSSKTI